MKFYLIITSLLFILITFSSHKLVHCVEEGCHDNNGTTTTITPTVQQAYTWMWRRDEVTGNFSWQLVCVQYNSGNTTPRSISNTSTPLDPYANDPVRDSRLIVISAKPYNAETPVELIVQNYYTPNELFYVRNNLPVPLVNIEDYKLQIFGSGIIPTNLTLVQLKTLFPPKNLTSVLQCAGNRRLEMNEYKPVRGSLWGGGAIGNALWTGADLKAVLAYAGFDPRKYSNLANIHIQFEGLDQHPVTKERYGASIPVRYLLDGNFEPLLAYSMNTHQLPRDHGFPLRVVLPGIVGVRNVKWLHKITIAEQESQASYQTKRYKAFSPGISNTTVTKADYEATLPILDLPVTSYITSHKGGGLIRSGQGLLAGYAYSGGGQSIQRVEVSMDRGNNWVLTEIFRTSNEKWVKTWTWVFWRANVQFSKGWQEIWVKAVDSGNNQQPQDLKNIWNFEGYLTNTYHKIVLFGT